MGGGGDPAPPHPFILQNCVYLLPQFAVNLWESGIGVSGLVWGLFGFVFGGTLLLVDDGVPLEMALGGFGAGLELLILLFQESLQPAHLLFNMYLLMFFMFLVSGFYMWSLYILVLVMGKLV